MEKDAVIYSNFVANANWNAIEDLVSGSCMVIDSGTADWWRLSPSGTVYDIPVLYGATDDWIIKSDQSVEILQCKHCNQRHRIDYEKLDAIAVLDCKKCGAPLV